MRACLCLCLLLTLAVACQPAGGPPGGVATAPAGGAATDAIGAPQSGLPSDLPALLQRGHDVAKEWQEEPVLSEVQVDVDEAGAWTGVRLVYLAADADRFLQLVDQGGHFSEQRPSLASLEIQSVPAEGLDQLPDFPSDAMTPEELATADAARECGVEGPATVLYATGAPVAWNGTAWASPPQWRALVTADDGAGVELDISTGASDGCLD